MSTSFPFLKIARDFGLPYGLVIRIVEMFERAEELVGSMPEGADLQGRTAALTRAIRFAIDREHQRRLHVRAEAGL